MRSAVPEGDAEALGGTDGDVGAPFPRRLEQGQGQEVGRHRHQRALGVRCRGQGLEVTQCSRTTRILLHQPEIVTRRRAGAEVDHIHDEAQRPQPCRQHGDGLRQAVGIDDDPIRFARGPSTHQCDGLGHRRALVEE